AHWRSVGGGEAGFVVPKPDDPNVIYAGEYLGIITYFDHRRRQPRNVVAYPENGSGPGAEDLRYRFQWTAPIATSPHDAKVVYHGGNVLFRSADGGPACGAVSPDLTRNDKSKQKWAGGPITGDNTGFEFYGTIFAAAESPREAGLIWAGSDDGLVHVTRDGGKSWSDVTRNVPGFPEWGTGTRCERAPFAAATGYLVVDAHRLDDTHPYLWKTTDYGKAWKRLSAGLPQDVYLHAVREDPKRRGLLYLGTERGVMVSPDDGASWQPLHLGLPTVAVHDLVVKDNDLVLATMGRSLWIFDDLTPIRETSPKLREEDVHLFTPQPAIRWRVRSEWHGADEEGSREPGGAPNPPRGALVYYYLKRKTTAEIRLEILDSPGSVIRTPRSTPEPAKYPPDDPDEPKEAPKPALGSDSGGQAAVWNPAYER